MARVISNPQTEGVPIVGWLDSQSVFVCGQPFSYCENIHGQQQPYWLFFSSSAGQEVAALSSGYRVGEHHVSIELSYHIAFLMQKLSPVHSTSSWAPHVAETKRNTGLCGQNFQKLRVFFFGALDFGFPACNNLRGSDFHEGLSGRALKIRPC